MLHIFEVRKKYQFLFNRVHVFPLYLYIYIYIYINKKSSNYIIEIVLTFSNKLNIFTLIITFNYNNILSKKIKAVKNVYYFSKKNFKKLVHCIFQGFLWVNVLSNFY